MKKFTTFVLGICFIFYACGDSKADKNNDATVQETDFDTVAKTIKQKAAVSEKNATDVYFKANGTEPFWSLTISERMIKLKTVGDSIMTPHTIPNSTQDNNIKHYALHTEMAKMNIQIKKLECINASSGLASPYSVNIEFMKGKASDFTKLEGCGNYITDYRLHDIWVLETLNANKVTKENFKKDLPSIEINSTSNTFTGFAGCNKMNGKLFYEKDVLQFTDVSTTKMACKDNLENEFLSALKSGTSYKIENNRLSLSNASGELLVFKKID
ncbi:MAG: META domain-containing protein [Flavobacteriaceae bacterium]